MPKNPNELHLYLRDGERETLDALAAAWGLSRAATIRKLIQEATR